MSSTSATFHCSLCDCYCQLHDRPAHMNGSRHKANLMKLKLSSEKPPVPTPQPLAAPIQPSSEEVKPIVKASVSSGGCCRECSSDNLDVNFHREYPLCQACAHSCKPCSRLFKGSHHNAINHYRSSIHRAGKGSVVSEPLVDRSLLVPFAESYHFCSLCGIYMSKKDVVPHERGKKHLSMVEQQNNNQFPKLGQLTISSPPRLFSDAAMELATAKKNAEYLRQDVVSANVSVPSYTKPDTTFPLSISSNLKKAEFHIKEEQPSRASSVADVPIVSSQPSKTVPVFETKSEAKSEEKPTPVHTTKTESEPLQTIVEPVVHVSPPPITAPPQPLKEPIQTPQRYTPPVNVVVQSTPPSGMSHYEMCFDFLVNDSRVYDKSTVKSLMSGLLTEFLDLQSQNALLKKKIVELKSAVDQRSSQPHPSLIDYSSGSYPFLFKFDED
ncbi:hypothetical protein RCL1_001791 [Eukaryota sp. TZLM3-RCL]